VTAVLCVVVYVLVIVPVAILLGRALKTADRRAQEVQQVAEWDAFRDAMNKDSAA